ncbi:hypoxia up-regulated protein 1-like [Actinia tenebrosa]|uniref:Hypoxia up-regulated protein 1 n=1 Tax=Actinia tenebrosa TaxID=6105 RepID=A0A6P8H4W9_ACTTE|nr:hypoxia up-regulated protein 1-like [Actinia tenebrosa]
MNDNTAVALNFGLFRQKSFNESLEKHIMFYDMGASNTVATIVGYSMVKSKERGITEKVPQLVVKGVGFDRGLGGHAIDMRLRDHLVKLFKKNYKPKGEVTESPRAMAKFYKEALRVKQVLSANSDHFAQIEGVFEEIDFRTKVTREELEDMCKDLFERVADPVYKALKSASMTMNDIESVVLAGGGTRVPKVQEALLKAVEKPELAKNINADEAAAMGAVYQAANLGKGFKVKQFLIRDTNIYPIQVSFDRHIKADDGSESVRHVKRVIYHHANVVPQKKVMTFNKHTDDFDFHVAYTGLENILSDKEIQMFGSLNISTIGIKGVAAALDKHAKGQSKGIKAHFKLDENGLFSLDRVESVFEKTAEQVEKEEESTLSKLGSKISSFFGAGGDEDKKEAKVEESKEADKDEKAEEEKEAKKEQKDDKDKEESKEELKKEEERKDKEDEKEKEKEKDKTEGEPKREEKKDDKKEEDSKAENKKTSEKSAKANGTEEAEKKPVKPVVIREPLETVIEIQDLVDPSEKSLTESKEKLTKLQEIDDAKAAKERMKNTLESHIFETRDKLYSDVGEELSTEAERDTINQALSQASDWLDDEGWDTTADVYEEKLKALKKISIDFRRRLKEHELRPKAVAALLQSLNLSSTFYNQIQNMTDKNEIFTAKDLEELSKVNNETMDWLTLMIKKQNETKPHENPVILAKDIEAKQAKIDRELVYLLNKAKYFVPKPKVNETADAGNKTSNNTTKSSNGKNKTDKSDSGFKAKKSFKKQNKKAKNDQEKKEAPPKPDEKAELPDKAKNDQENKESPPKPDEKAELPSASDKTIEEPLPTPKQEEKPKDEEDTNDKPVTDEL